LQVSAPLQNTPSSHEVPAVRLAQAAGDAPALQYWHGYPGRAVPLVQHAPSIQHDPAATSQRSADSLQVRHVSGHGSPAETHVPDALQASTPVQNTPSSHEYPTALFVHDVLLEAPLQYWHG
jgi:hypothetical protein